MGNVELLRKPEEARKLIDDLLVEAKNLADMGVNSSDDIKEFRESYLTWEDSAKTVLQTTFKTSGAFTSGPLQDFTAVGLQLLDLKINSTALPPSRVQEVRNDILERMRVLRSIHKKIELYAPLEPSVERKFGDAVFLVHGHDLVRRETVRRFLEKVCERNVVVLEDMPNQGRDILGKLLDHAVSASFAVVLMTGDDEGRPRAETEWVPRARQNVILELGLFLGLLGRSRVVALYEPGVEIPSDYSGVTWVEASGESWQVELAREMKSAGIEVSLDSIL